VTMLYIHELRQLSISSADVESLTILRELRKELRIPVTEEQLQALFIQFFVSQTEVDHILRAKELLPLTISAVEHLLTYPTRLYEDDNLHRAIHMLGELPSPLEKNYQFVRNIVDWQTSSSIEIVQILQGIQKHENLLELNQRLNSIFQKLLRNTTFTFHYNDIIDEGCKARILNLREGLQQGFFYAKTLDTQIIQERFKEELMKIPAEEKLKVDSIQKQVIEIQKGIDCVYAINMRMIEWVVLLYSLVKFAQQH